jgi:hypothetical protein
VGRTIGRMLSVETSIKVLSVLKRLRWAYNGFISIVLGATLLSLGEQAMIALGWLDLPEAARWQLSGMAGFVSAAGCFAVLCWSWLQMKALRGVVEQVIAGAGTKLPPELMGRQRGTYIFRKFGDRFVSSNSGVGIWERVSLNTNEQGVFCIVEDDPECTTVIGGDSHL